MKKSNDSKSQYGQRRYNKNINRIADKPKLSKHEKWEIRERAKIVLEALRKDPL
jgi:ribosomal protein L44E